jgi:hypothetical protein
MIHIKERSKMKTIEEINAKIKANEEDIERLRAKVLTTHNRDARQLYIGIVNHYFAYIEALNWTLEGS